MLAETAAAFTKISLRSKAPDDGDDRSADLADVSRLARRLGGGGHTMAAGARMDVGLAEARRAVLDALEDRSVSVGES